MTAYSIADYDRSVAELVAKGFAPSVAATEVRRQLLGSVPSQQQLEVVAAIDERIERSENVLEKEEQLEIRKLAIAYGFKVKNLSQARKSRIAYGIPDLYLVHKTLPIALWWESKRQVGGERTTQQEEFGDDMVRCAVGYGFGDRYNFVEKLLELELAVRGAGPYSIEPLRLKSPQPTY